MSQDPLQAFVARSLGADVADVRSETLQTVDDAERERIRFTRDGTAQSLVIERVAPDRGLEVSLLPFLARKTDRVPRVYARGIPPSAVPARSWVLIEDLVETQKACDSDPVGIVRAKIAVERAVAGDGPALRALGVPALTPGDLVARAAPRVMDDRQMAAAAVAAERLSMWPASLAHGDLRCARAIAIARGVVITGWGRAFVGCALLDVARLCADLRARGEGSSADAAAAVYLDETSDPGARERLRDAEVVDALLREASSTYN